MPQAESVEQFHDVAEEPQVRGFLHRPIGQIKGCIALTHGAGGNCQSQLLISLATAFAGEGLLVLRFNLPFRQERPTGPPSPGSAARDREGLVRCVSLLEQMSQGPVFVGGHSYGGRQATMLAAERPDLVRALLLLSYPLHPPRRPEQLRTAHWPKLESPAMFVHGSRDPFGSLVEMESALRLIPARKLLLPVEGAGHELAKKASVNDLSELVVSTFVRFAQLGVG